MPTTKLRDDFLSGNETDMSLLNQPLLTPGFKRDMIHCLVEHADALYKSPTSLQLLAKAFAGEKVVHLTLFRNMPPMIIRALLQSDELKQTRLLNLSSIEAVSDGEILETLGSIKYDLDKLYLLSKPDHGISMSVIYMETDNQLTYPKHLRMLLQVLASLQSRLQLTGRLTTNPTYSKPCVKRTTKYGIEEVIKKHRCHHWWCRSSPTD